MSALLITLVLITSPSVNAQSYVADDNYSISTQYHDIFNNYFDGSKSYQYFPYKCNYGNSYYRECYFGIDSDGNYLKIDYKYENNNYTTNYSTGVDESFSVSGNNIFKKGVSTERVYLYAIVFCALILLINYIL